MATCYRAAVEEHQAEHAYLVWFAQNADFGPAHGDVIEIMHKQYEEQTGNKVPKDWIE